MELTVPIIVIAALAGVGAHLAWDSRRELSMGLVTVTVLAGAAGVVAACLSALGVVFRLLPLALLAFGVWLIHRNATHPDPDSTPTRSFREVT